MRRGRIYFKLLNDNRTGHRTQSSGCFYEDNFKPSQQLKMGLQCKLFETSGCFCRVRCSLASKSDWVACNNRHCDYNNTVVFVFHGQRKHWNLKWRSFFHPPITSNCEEASEPNSMGSEWRPVWRNTLPAECWVGDWWTNDASSPWRALTFSVERSVSLSCFLCVKTMVKTAWDLLLVSFMLVAATVLRVNTYEHC